eukprot:jgi/Botrbrau1/20748/Bobra.0058s0076.1
MRCRRKLSADERTIDIGAVAKRSKHSLADKRGIIDERCGSHVAAAKLGHLHCLQGLLGFLPMDSPKRASEGEA